MYPQKVQNQSLPVALKDLSTTLPTWKTLTTRPHYLQTTPNPDTPTPLQSIMLAKDCMAGRLYERKGVFLWLPTGFGKSICYEV